jgi:DNA-damage-inducible protein J
MAQVNFRIDDETKRQAEELFGQMGLTMSGAIMVFIRQSINEQCIPFRVSARNAIYHEKLLQAKRDWENGRKNFHYHDLIEVEDDVKAPHPKAKGRPRRAAQRRRRPVA